jgi:hypothetical protein
MAVMKKRRQTTGEQTSFPSPGSPAKQMGKPSGRTRQPAEKISGVARPILNEATLICAGAIVCYFQPASAERYMLDQRIDGFVHDFRKGIGINTHREDQYG